MRGPEAFLFLALAAYSVWGKTNACPEGWFGYGSSKCFLVSNETGYWFNGFKFCRSVQANLASINTAEENFFAAGVLEVRGISAVWIGFNDERVEGIYENADETPVTYVNFAPGEFEMSKEASEDCVEMRKDLDYCWSVAHCFKEKRNYLCSLTL